VNAFYSSNPLWLNGGKPYWDLALALVTAHLAGDFVFQTGRMVAAKHRMSVLLAHAAIQAVLAYVLAGRWSVGTIPGVVFVSHGLVDFWKARAPGASAARFWIDQVAHLAVITLLVWWSGHTQAPGYWTQMLGAGAWRLLVFASGAILCVRVCSIVVGFWVQPYLAEINEAAKEGLGTGSSRGLTNGGRVIGQWERALVFIFVFMGQPTAIGFLIAAKSIFRFGELMDRRNRMEAEYITIGTLMSFGMAIAIALGTLLLCRRL